ncbi:MAG: STAS domain-containing protein [Oleiphilaceae bacterium]|nr:STAS domain-containing protein [Oleiphilaceae bacterium]
MFSIQPHIDDDGTATLFMAGQFDFNAYTEFKPHQTQLLENPAVKTIVLNVSRLDYLDSAALGTLLLLREKAQDRNIDVAISGATGIVLEILEIAHFQRMFRFIEQKNH